MTIEKPSYAYIEFKKIKTSGPKGKIRTPETYFLKIEGNVHNQPEKILMHMARGAVLKGYGNLSNPKYDAVRTIIDRMLRGQEELLATETGAIAEPMKDKVNEQRAKQATR